MSTPVCVSCRENLSCSDSPLSVTGNIIGILTFAGALVISIQVYYNSMINANRNTLEMIADFRAQIRKLIRLQTQTETQIEQMNDDQKNRLLDAFIQCEDSRTKAGHYLVVLGKSRVTGQGPRPNDHQSPSAPHIERYSPPDQEQYATSLDGQRTPPGSNPDASPHATAPSDANLNAPPHVTPPPNDTSLPLRTRVYFIVKEGSIKSAWARLEKSIHAIDEIIAEVLAE
ncbi:hypothetical protein BT63DRAFT_93482 [Microthyrium microscopicum]|uniref:Uncharacterized protein n=1 Tax=Microthyrium microscopicum TaxID=703497 RepID=A0A6A6TY15_9PEZI|nr:hypothetical protein BT63DRAFT_93482 [Microthyrium microscopicum]